MNARCEVESDDVCMERIVQGDHGAFEVLHTRYNRDLISGLRYQGMSLHDAENNAQEAWLSVYTKCAMYQPGNFYGWLWTIAVNRRIDNFRRTSISQSFTTQPEEDFLERYLTVTDDYGDRMDRAECSARVVECLATIPADQSQVFSLFIFGGMSMPEIAEIQGISVSSVKSRFRLAKEKIREALGVVMVDNKEQKQTVSLALTQLTMF